MPVGSMMPPSDHAGSKNSHTDTAMAEWEKAIKAQISYDNLLQAYPADKDAIDVIIELVADVMCRKGGKNSASRPIAADEDCPESTPEQLERFRKFGQERNKRRAEMEKL